MMDKEMQETITKLFDQLGGYGLYQKWIFFLVCLAPVMTGMSVVNQVFVGLAVPYRCAVSECEVYSNSSYSQDFLNFTTPFDQFDEKWSSCNTFAHKADNSSDGMCSPEEFNSSQTEKCSHWVYDTSMFQSTLVTEFDLTCERAWMQSLGGSAYMFGFAVGAVLLGDIADRIGRKKGLVVSVFVLGVGELIGSFSVNFYMYIAMRFISGIGSIATFQNAIIQALEFVSAEWRTFCGMMIKIPFALGETSVAGFAYFIRSWRFLQLTLSIPVFFLLAYWWIMPESVRWLLAHGRCKEAIKIIDRAAEVNKKQISPEIYETLIEHEGIANTSEDDSILQKRSTFDLFKSPNLRKRTFNLMFAWVAITHNFYGLSSNSANFGGNLFVNFVAIMLIEVPSYIIAYLVLDKLGRKGTLVLLMLTGGTCCFVASMINESLGWVIIALSIGGKFCVAAAFAVIYIYTIEIFPTKYRSLGLGACSMSARIGGVIAPFTAGLASIYRPLPLIIFGVLALVCGMLLFLLPETYGSELPQSLQDSENYGTDQSIFYFTCCKKWKKNTTHKQSIDVIK